MYKSRSFQFSSVYLFKSFVLLSRLSHLVKMLNNSGYLRVFACSNYISQIKFKV